jgi:hypothetical protein
MAKRVKIGDIVEVETARGMAYIQMTHKVEKWGALIRVIHGLFESRPENLQRLSESESDFVTFFPLQVAINRNIFEIVGHGPVPAQAQIFPLFRDAGFIDRSGKVHDWWLWDGEKAWRVRKLSVEQRYLPIREVINDTLLIERIEEGWRPENDPF